MGTVNQHAIMAWLQYQARQLGWQGLVGLVLLVISAALVLGWLVPGNTHLAQREQELDVLRATMPQHQARFVDRSPQATLNTFYGFLPAEKEATRLLGVILTTATEHQLAPEKADYSLARSPAAAFTRYQITLPVRGNYVQIRSFANQVLQRIPSAALNEITLKRQDINTEALEARLRFTVFLQRGQS
jgi:Tfp pilus assembly protein PilO